jgi:hypothetical protein
VAGQLGGGEVESALLQAALADPAGDGVSVLLEELVEVAQGDVVGRGDRVRGEVRATEVGPNEAVDLGHQCASAGVGRHRVLCVQCVGERRGQYVEREG